MPSSPSPATRLNALGIDLSPRMVRSATVAASPSAATETIVASVTVPNFPSVNLGVLLLGFGAFTVGTAGVSVNLKLRQTDASGSTVKATGAVTYTAADLGSLAVVGFDTSPTLPGQVYVLTATVASANAASTFSAVELVAIVI